MSSCAPAHSVRNKKTSSEQQFCGQKLLVTERGERRRVKAGRKVTQITTHYNSGMQKSISEHTLNLEEDGF